MTPDAKADAIVAQFPGPVTLYPSRLKFMVLLAVCLAFSVGGLMMVLDRAPTGWFVLIFFGFGALVSLLVMLPSASGLTLDRDGFEPRSMYRSARTRWQDASGFTTSALPPSGYVLVVYDDSTIEPGVVAATNVSLTERNAALPDSYGMKPAELAVLLEKWRARALR